MNNKSLRLSHVYVGLSRARLASGLYIRGQFFQPNVTDSVKEVMSEVNRLKTEAALSFTLQFICDSSSGIKIMYHNVQSLKKNYIDIISDPNYMEADILLFVETWLIEEENINLTNFNLVSQITSKKERKAYGCAIYSKLECQLLFKIKFQDKKTYFNCIGISLNNMDILLIYTSVNTTKHDLLSQVDECLPKVKNDKVMIIGDFNIDVMSDSNKDFVSSMNNKGFLLLNNGVTTNGNTQIDLVFARNFKTTINTYESYFSYHKPLWFSI
jgi:exonuclease III